MIKKFLQLVLETGASNLHIATGEPPILRVNGTLQRTDFAAFDSDQVKSICYSFLTPKQIEQFEKTNELDLSTGIEGMGRFRVNIYRDRIGMAAAFRIITEKIPSLEQLGLPATTKDVAKLPRGLVLVTGPTGSGKSTTLAAIIDWINTHRAEHILTIEDPIEFVHKSKKSLINQREVGADTYSFQAALKSSLREDPDVILIGEMRDLETISLAVTAAETGHLVFGTLHTSSAATTIDRLVDVFPHEQQTQIRIQLSGSLKAVLSQTLLPKKTGDGRCMAMEIMTVTPGIANLIREGKTSQIYSAIQTGRKEGMQTLEASLADLYKQGLVRVEDIIAKSSKADELRNLLGSDVITNELLVAA
jgi:twitching motility protein PilT